MLDRVGVVDGHAGVVERELAARDPRALGLFQPFGGFPDGVKVENSFVTLPDLPGIGFEGKADLYREMQALSA